MENGSAGAEERKPVTVLFADLVGFTSRAEGMDPEDVRRLLSLYWGSLREELERHGGTVEKFIGDAVVAVFGAPVGHEDDPERAVRAALAIREAIADLNASNPEFDFHVRVGVNTGEALITLDASVREGEGMAAGDVINTGARLEAAAPTDGILVSESTYRATERAIEYREAERIDARGKSEPVRVWEALAPRRVDIQSIREGLALLVGRRFELARLRAALERSRRGGIELVTLVGSPGIGKSRLLYEFLAACEADPERILWWRGQSRPYGESVIFSAFADVVRAHAGILERDSASGAGVKLGAAVAAAVDGQDEAAWVERHLRPLVGLAADGEIGRDRQAEAFAAWTRFLEGVAAEIPLVLALEDVHWADEGLLDFVEYLAGRDGGTRLLVLVTARPELLERRPAWAGVVRLYPLADREIGQLLTAGIRKALPDATRAAVVEHAAGNPLYAEEYIRMVSDRPLLETEVGHLPLPETVQGIIGARLDALARTEKKLVQGAAVVGEIFWPGALMAVSEATGEAVVGSLAVLESRELIRRERRSSLAGEAQYAFHHVLVHDVAYGQITRADRARIHRRAAEWIEDLAPDRAEDKTELLAHHYSRALEFASLTGSGTVDLEARTRLALRAAGERAVSLHALAVAARHYEAALKLWPKGDPERAELLLELARARHYGEHRWSEELVKLRDALLAAGDPAGAAEVGAYISWVLDDAGQTQRAHPYLADAVELVRDTPASRSKIVVLNLLGAHLAISQGRNEEAAAVCGEALAMAEELGLEELCVQSLNVLGAARSGAEGIADLERGVAIAERIGSPEGLIANLSLAAELTIAGDLRRSHEAIARAYRDIDRFGNWAGMADWLNVARAEMFFESGVWEDALAAADDFLARETPRYLVSPCRIVRGQVLLARGDPIAALAEGRQSLEVAREVRDAQILHPALAFAARASLIAGEKVGADALAEELLEIWNIGRPAGHSSTGSLPDLAVVLAALGRGDRLLTWVERADRGNPWFAAAHAYVTEDYRCAADLYHEIGSLPNEAYARLRAGEALVANDCRREAEDELQQALAFYRHVDATAYVEQAEALLSPANVE